MFVAPSDFVLNGESHGAVGGLLSDIQYDTGLLRPFFDKRGRSCVLVNTGEEAPRLKPGSDVEFITNEHGIEVQFPKHEKKLVADLLVNHGMTNMVRNTTVLTKEQWITLTNIVKTEYRKRLRAWSDLSSMSSFGGFDGMSTMMLEYQTMSDPGEAVVDFDGMTEGRNDKPVFKLEGLPLPITHADFFFPERMLAISRKGGTSLNTRMAEAAGRRVAESVEKTLIGTLVGPTLGDQASGGAGIAYGRTPSVYGYTNHPARITKADFTDPSLGPSTPQDTIDDILEALELLRAQNFFGPFMIYNSTDWDRFLDDDYSVGADAGNKTLRNRIREIDEVSDVRRLDFLSSTTNPFTFLIISMTSDVVQAVNGMDITTVQWPSMGGMRQNFKVMAIQVPLITPDFSDRVGILHGTIS